MTSRTIAPAPVRKKIVVKATPDNAFKIFTEGMSGWWLKDKSIGSAPQKEVVLEPRVGGRWFERGEDGSECSWGCVLAWEPPTRLVLAWQINGSWQFDPALVTEVEVRFVAEGPRLTRVELEHRNIDRFGEQASAIRAAFDSEQGWPSLLASFASVVEVPA